VTSDRISEMTTYLKKGTCKSGFKTGCLHQMIDTASLTVS